MKMIILSTFLLSLTITPMTATSGKNNPAIHQAVQDIELSFDKKGFLIVKAPTAISKVRLFNDAGKKIEVPADGQTQLKIQEELPKGNWYVQVKTTDGKSALRSITVK